MTRLRRPLPLWRRIVSRPRGLVAIGVGVVALIVVPVALAGARIYWYQKNISANTGVTDGVYHNHSYNEMHWGAGATWPGELYMVTLAGDVHFLHTFNGNAAFSNAGTYFDTPVCVNGDGTSHFVDHCNTLW